MSSQIPMDRSVIAQSASKGAVQEVQTDIAYRRLGIVNVVFLGTADRWVLVDAGLSGTASFIRSAAEGRFGRNVPPAAIILTHGHFDHVGAVQELADGWQVPIFAHPLEQPYLDGSSSYPQPDPRVGGGLMTMAAPLYPRGPIDVRQRLKSLPEDGAVPGLEGWRWLHTPGHSPGHVSLWRESDRTLIAGDAVITTRQESAYSVLTQRPELHGPPMYYTPDWQRAHESVVLIASLEPNLLLSGHGQPFEGATMRQGLRSLADKFHEIAVPRQGRYIERPARPEDGSAYRH
jgi:glyoxylase-like metal-dependent hydrolase (beta-lactamase superfamily II)